MIAEIKFKNMFSFRDETVLSFEADKSKDLESYHVVELAPDVKLLKLAVIYGANASGKSNIIKVCDFIRSFITCTPLNKAELIKIVPFLLNRISKEQASEFSVSFYAMNGDKAIRYVYSVLLETTHIVRETLIYYLSQQPATVFERSMENNVSSIKFGQKVKISTAAKEEITLKCLPNMSVFAAYMQVNTNIAEMETALQYLTKQMMPAIVPTSSLSRYAEEAIKKETAKEYILRYLQEADFNISNISSKEQETKKGVVNYTMYQHKVSSGLGGNDYYEFPELYESDGTIRTFGLASQIQNSIGSNAFLAVDEIESSLHPKLIEYMIERFLKESKQAQLLLTTHYDGLLGEEDLLRKDNIWFAEKNTDGASVLYPLTDFKGLNRISSLQKAYKFGKFGAVPNL
ncbi:AAA family ATPase [Parabacteroides distasonis]|uniref:AAA family ATPase n=1 Tax=Parabacteroides distasonis TaxID=823 RepID=UPI00189A429E|nr:ATP-binding protein [Parabacteroides distasonis]MDB9191476.1 ATP-binding protein [Parabacteroides distasonis]MDB9200225.1 ATP-binding protein [Parabacteroides distasonis]